jgi:hypothetical protein
MEARNISLGGSPSGVTLAVIGMLVAGCVLGPASSPEAIPTATVPPSETPAPQVTPAPSPSATPASATPTPAPTPASATPTPADPTNTPLPPVAGDDIDDPVIIQSVPSSYELDVAGATSDPTDPTDCSFVGTPSVWLAFTPAESETMTATTRGSTFDTVLYLALRDANGRINVMDCSDDAISGLHSSIRFDASTGVTYLFMITGFDEQTVGELSFELDRYVGGDEPSVAIEINRRVTVDAAGAATVAGVVSCSSPIDYLYLEVSIRQRVGRTVIQGWGELEVVDCTAAGVPWSTRVPSEALAFGDEPATVYVATLVCGEWDCLTFEAERDVRMRLR